MIAEGLTYLNALELIAKLETKDIYANITVGGVSVDTTKDNEALAQEICKKHGAFINNQAISTLAGFQLIGLSEKNNTTIDIEVFMTKEEIESEAAQND